MFKKLLLLLIFLVIPMKIANCMQRTQLATPQQTKNYHDAYNALFRVHDQKAARRLIAEKRDILMSSHNGFNLMFKKAAKYGFLDIIEEFATSQDLPYKPNRDDVSGALMNAVFGKHTDIMEYLMTPHEGVSMSLPDRSAVDHAFESTLGEIDLVRLLLTPHEDVPLPSEAEIIAEYRVIIVDEDIAPDRKRELLALLEPHVPEAERRAQRRGNGVGQGVAYRVHDYADTQVAVKSDKSCGSPKTMRANDAAIHMIEKSLKGKTLANASEITTRLTDWIDAKYQKAEANALARQAMSYGWTNDNTPPRNLILVFSFLKQHYPDHFDVWLRGYITESITAYESRNNPLSCVKGIDERIITGLRGIDPEIDALYETPERNEMVKSIFTNYNIGTSEGAAQVARVLLNHSITASNTAEEAVPIFEQFLTEKITSTGATPDPKDIENIIGTIRDDYDSIVKPALREQKRNLAADAAEARMKIKQK
jgi:hypothetical protein